jgi:hypothetical protein
VLQRLIQMGERSSLPMRIATTESVSLCMRMNVHGGIASASGWLRRLVRSVT